jgi:hypothetical protein
VPGKHHAGAHESVQDEEQKGKCMAVSQWSDLHQLGSEHVDSLYFYPLFWQWS